MLALLRKPNVSISEVSFSSEGPKGWPDRNGRSRSHPERMLSRRSFDETKGLWSEARPHLKAGKPHILEACPFRKPHRILNQRMAWECDNMRVITPRGRPGQKYAGSRVSRNLESNLGWRGPEAMPSGAPTQNNRVT
jgi:hypothetical protein